MEESMQQYKSQLKQVEEALRCSKDNKEIESLTSLKADLEELIELTKQTVTQETDDTESNSNATLNYINSNSNSMDDEMALFMSEIRSMETTADSVLTSNCDTDEQVDVKLQTLKDELEAMVGKKCSAPHEHTWGARAYHNAIICGVDSTREYDLKNIKEFRLRILFTNPTHKEMIPCGYYLDGNCRFDKDKCRFSHGELVPFGDLRDYKEPEFDKLKRNCIVLAKMSDKMWHKGRVLCVNFIEKNCRVKIENKKKEEDFNFEDLLPIYYDDDNSSTGSSDSDDEEEGRDITELRDAYLIEKTLLTPAIDQALGEWEKHTRGIGSKLMQKMGYIVGASLGSRGEGIIVPISAQILPPGRSLDHCMELREAANGDKDLFSVERKLDIQKKKQEAINAKTYDRAKNKTDIFSFLNDTIFSTTQDSKSETSVSQHRHMFKNHSTKTLNVESLKIAEDIRRKEREIQKLQESMRRHASGSDVHKKLQIQLSMKNQELGSLKKSESTVAREQQSRRYKDKMAVF